MHHAPVIWGLHWDMFRVALQLPPTWASSCWLLFSPDHFNFGMFMHARLLNGSVPNDWGRWPKLPSGCFIYLTSEVKPIYVRVTWSWLVLLGLPASLSRGTPSRLDVGHIGGGPGLDSFATLSYQNSCSSSSYQTAQEPLACIEYSELSHPEMFSDAVEASEDSPSSG